MCFSDKYYINPVPHFNYFLTQTCSYGVLGFIITEHRLGYEPLRVQGIAGARERLLGDWQLRLQSLDVSQVLGLASSDPGEAPLQVQ
jgi:hypothetical protein